jgi:pantoate--beta-alanine ligase
MNKQTELSVISSKEDLNSWRQKITGGNLSVTDKRPLIGLVPTMGALHAGHLSLINLARAQCQFVVVSIFVNPLQFGPTEDFATYPRTFEADRKICQDAGVDVIFNPTVDVMYPGGKDQTTRIVPPEILEKSLYGQFRPAFFSGVATVVARLFNLVQPTVAYFGEKDYQQLLVVKRMVRDLQMPINIIGVETVREEDGLAMSSRNVFLDDKQRQDARKIHATLTSIKEKSLAEPEKLKYFLTEGKQSLSSLNDVDTKYLVACDSEDLTELDTAKKPMVLLAAAKFREVWLIDTLVVD